MTDEPISINFTHLSQEQLVELENAFPNADIIESDAFSGEKIWSLLIDTSESAIKQLAELFQRWKNSSQKVVFKIGDVEVSVEGFDAKDTQAVIAEIRRTIEKASK